MARPCKDYKVFSGRICKPSADRLDRISKETGLPKTVVVEKAIDVFFNRYKETGRIN